MKKLRGLFRIIFGRTAFVVLFMAIQVGILFGAFRWLEEYMHIVYAISILLSAAVIIYIFNPGHLKAGSNRFIENINDDCLAEKDG